MIHTHKDLQAEEHARWKEKRKQKKKQNKNLALVTLITARQVESG